MKKYKLSEIDQQIDQLSDALIHANCCDTQNVAPVLVSKLEALLLSCGPRNAPKYLASWIEVHEAHGDIEEAIRLQDEYIQEELRQIDEGEYDDYPKLLVRQVQQLMDCFYLQAEREMIRGDVQAARQRLRDLWSLGERFNIQPDEDSHWLLKTIESKSEDESGKGDATL